MEERYLVGKVCMFARNGDGDEIGNGKEGTIIEVTELDGEDVELAANVAGRRTYFKFSLSDLMRAALKKEGA